MLKIENGMCGLCTHFGEHHGGDELIQIRVNHEAPETLTEECGKPELEPLHLKVSAVSSCDGFEPVRRAS
ncbi:hypothetical protein JD969_15360 [Planctomycetota bacterium]|nr:hypothetical protein JD969_15360 [Planctomycetota bacterium]